MDTGKIVADGADVLGLTLPSNAVAAFEAYYSFLENRNQVINLTSISGVVDVARLHFLDSIAILKCVAFKDSRVIDIGSGAGFPGIPLKIAEPSIDLTLLDSSVKRVKFLKDLCSTLALSATCIHARAEEVAHIPDLRESYDIAVSRAVARLNILSELCLPFVMVGGFFIAMKSTDSSYELSEALAGTQMLGAEFHGNFDYTIPLTNISHRGVLFRKISLTPEKYPRRFSRIQKTPLESQPRTASNGRTG